MTMLVDFIKNIEDEVLEKVEYITRFKKEEVHSAYIWVHQLTGKVIVNDWPSKPGYIRKSLYMLCTLDKDLHCVPDIKAIKKWVEQEVLVHPSSVKKPRRKSAAVQSTIFL